MDKLERTVNRELNKWLNVNRLSLNIDKTNFIVFHPYNKPIKKSIIIKSNNKAIIEKEYIKYLGVLIDSTQAGSIMFQIYLRRYHALLALCIN